MSGSKVNILLGQPDSTEAKPGISAAELDQARRGGQTAPLLGQEQTAPARGRGPLQTVWELALGFTDVIARQKCFWCTSGQGGTGTASEPFTSCTPIKI